MFARKTIISAVILLVLIALGILAFIFFKNRRPTAGLRVESIPSALVYVNNKEIGSTPIEAYFPPGEIHVKIVPESGSDFSSPYLTKVKLTDKFTTTIRREFAATDAESSGEIISLQPQPGSAPGLDVITSSPNSASVTVNGQPEGFTPLRISDISEGQHQIILAAPDYKPKTINAKVIAGYRLKIDAKLAALPAPTPTPATPSATLSPTPTLPSAASPTASPSPKPSPTPTPSLPRPYVRILDTPTGFLRVRSGPGKNFPEVGQVAPQQLFPLLGASGEWLNIKVDLAATTSGWISAQYAQKYE